MTMKNNGNGVFPYLQKIPEIFDSMLFCFHHAGGSAAAYFPFVQNEKNIAVIPVELPGHGIRREEKQRIYWNGMAENISQEIIKLTGEYQKPLRLMGCSLGSLIAFECALELQRRNTEIAEIIICSHSSPDVESPGYKTFMGKKALIDELNALSGTNSQIMQDEETLAFFLPVIQKDYALHDNYKYMGNVLDGVPMKVVVGNRDPYFNRENMKNWNKMTTGACQYMEFDGGHFVIYEKECFRRTVHGI